MILVANFIDNFHFLRPLWLLLLPGIIALYFFLRTFTSSQWRWQRIIEPALLDQLMISGQGNHRIRPLHLFAAALCLLALSAAGPTWERIQTPFVQNNAPLIIALELTPSMLATDVKPSRLQRAKQKISDLVATNVSSQIGVVVYSGTSHMVVPPTNDPALVNLYLENLTPDIMPVEGDRPQEALVLAKTLLANNPIPGTILFVTDGIDASLAAEFTETADTTMPQYLFWRFGTETGETASKGNTAIEGINSRGLDEIATASGGAVIAESLDGSDINQIQRSISTHLDNVLLPGQDEQWIDAGYYLLWPLVILLLPWARRGWTLRWS
jgi:Ca-activated chloride channel homolog